MFQTRNMFEIRLANFEEYHLSRHFHILRALILNSRQRRPNADLFRIPQVKGVEK